MYTKTYEIPYSFEVRETENDINTTYVSWCFAILTFCVFEFSTKGKNHLKFPRPLHRNAVHRRNKIIATTVYLRALSSRGWEICNVRRIRVAKKKKMERKKKENLWSQLYRAQDAEDLRFGGEPEDAEGCLRRRHAESSVVYGAVLPACIQHDRETRENGTL